MTMAARGYAKLIEEMGELTQVAGKRLAYYTTDDHPDGGPPLRERLVNEMGDVIAAINFVAEQEDLDWSQVIMRSIDKKRVYERWHAEAHNNADAVDG